MDILIDQIFIKLSQRDKEYKRIVLGDWYDKSFVLRISDGKIIIDKNNLS